MLLTLTSSCVPLPSLALSVVPRSLFPGSDFRALYSLRFVILLFWTASLGLSIYLGPKFLHSTKDTFAAPKGTPAYDATELWHQSEHHATSSAASPQLLR